MNVLLATLIPAYLFGAAILTHYGYNNFYGIPPEYISTSGTFYAIFALNIYSLTSAILSTILWWQWPIVLAVIGLLFFLYAIGGIWRLLVTSLIVIILVKALFGMITLGEIIAKTQARYLEPSSECLVSIAGKPYVIPVVRGDDAVLVPVDQDRVMSGTFLVKSIIGMGCEFTYVTGIPVTKRN